MVYEVQLHKEARLSAYPAGPEQMPAVAAFARVAQLASFSKAAAALGVAADRGQIARGFRADLVAWGVSEWREVAYWMGEQLVTAVWTGGSACPLPAGPVSLGPHVKA